MISPSLSLFPSLSLPLSLPPSLSHPHRSDFEYLVELDNTRWLSRIGELLETTLKVCEALTQESAHVLVCYENGWDRTTQVSYCKIV